MILFSWLVYFLHLLITGFVWWQPVFPCWEHLLDKGPCSASRDPFMSLVSISLLDNSLIITEGWVLRCLHTSSFIKTPSLEGLPTKAKGEPSPHEMRLSPLDINPVFPGLGYYYYYYYYYHHHYFIFLTKNEQFCNVCKTLVYLVPQWNQSYFFLNPQLHL